jgi:NADPH2 dehydrogenase
MAVPVLNRWSPYHFKPDVVARNRIVVPPMASQTADAEGRATERTIEHYRRLSESGAGLIFVEYSYVHPSGRSEAQQLGAASRAHEHGLATLASVIHASGALAGVQLVHCGGKSTHELTGGPLMAPSALRVPVKGWEPDLPQAMTLAHIREWREWFRSAAQRALHAGFDVIELHAAHGYGLNQWLSPLTNQRDDEYGGGIEARSRLLFEIVGDIVEQIKGEFPKAVLAVRVPGQDHLPGGLTSHDMKWVAKGLLAHGVELIDVSSGIGGWRRPEGREGEGYLVADAAELKTAIATPVIGVGGIKTGPFIDHLLASSQIDFTAVGRAILEDPRAWRDAHLDPESHVSRGLHRFRSRFV